MPNSHTCFTNVATQFLSCKFKSYHFFQNSFHYPKNCISLSIISLFISFFICTLKNIFCSFKRQCTERKEETKKIRAPIANLLPSYNHSNKGWATWSKISELRADVSHRCGNPTIWITLALLHRAGSKTEQSVLNRACQCHRQPLSVPHHTSSL